MLTRNDILKFATKLMSYFDKIGGLGDPTEDNAILGAPVTSLDQWMAQGKETGCRLLACTTILYVIPAVGLNCGSPIRWRGQPIKAQQNLPGPDNCRPG